jgi:hypothetical protein
MRRVLPYYQTTPPLDYATFLRQRMSHLRALPVLVGQRAYFLLHKEYVGFSGEVWMRLEHSYIVHHNGHSYAMECSLWHGATLADAVRLELLSCSSNHGRALCFN